MVDDAVTHSRLLNFIESGASPLFRVSYYSGSYHIQVDVNETASKVMVRGYCGCKIPVFPERATPTLPPVVFLGNAPRDEVHRSGYCTPLPFQHQDMHVIGCGNVIENGNPKALSSLEEPVPPTGAVTLKF